MGTSWCKLSPLIDRVDGRLKKELLNLQSKGAMPLVSALNDMIFKLHEDKFRKKMSPRLDRQDTLPQRNLSRDSQGEKAGKRKINSPSQISSSQSQPANEQKVSQSEKEGSSNGMSKKTSSRYSLRSSQIAKKQTTSVNEKNTWSEGFSETKDIMEYCEDNVSECVFKMIISDEFQVPNSLRIDHERVAELKSMLQTTPDKTQTFLGLVCATNEDDDRTSPFWVYVKGKLTVEQFQTKMSKLLARLGVSTTVFASISDVGYYRKPRTGIWEWMELRGNQGVGVDREKSCYCGDAAGRLVGHLPGRKKDFSCSDRLLATNLGVNFFTPEELFLGHKPSKQYNTPFHSNSLLSCPLLEPADSKLVIPTPFLALLVGIQGSGKSMEEKGVVVASNDRTGGKEKTLSTGRDSAHPPWMRDSRRSSRLTVFQLVERNGNCHSVGVWPPAEVSRRAKRLGVDMVLEATLLLISETGFLNILHGDSMLG